MEGKAVKSAMRGIERRKQVGLINQPEYLRQVERIITQNLRERK